MPPFTFSLFYAHYKRKPLFEGHLKKRPDLKYPLLKLMSRHVRTSLHDGGGTLHHKYVGLTSFMLQELTHALQNHVVSLLDLRDLRLMSYNSFMHFRSYAGEILRYSMP